MGFLDRLFGRRKRNGPEVLLVDDEDHVHRVATVHLDRHDANVVSARSSQEALTLAGSDDHRFKLFILDIMMPGENGIALAKKIRKVKRYQKTPILFVSGAFPPSQLEKVRKEIPHADFLTKPFRVEQFNAAVQKALGLVKA
jgi:CheY-like chemotaxis protein